MKVGTDAVLLGAWTNAGDAKTILDIGTGSGVIALMMAQQSSPATQIDAVELQLEDTLQARINVLNSPWPQKISVTRGAIQEFFPERKYDLIVCNPPYFSKSLVPPLENRTTARHSKSLTFAELINEVHRLMAPEGKFCLIVPSAMSGQFSHEAVLSGLFLQRQTQFFTRPGKPAERSLMEFGFLSVLPKPDELYLYASGNEWTEEYRNLTLDFYLDR